MACTDIQGHMPGPCVGLFSLRQPLLRCAFCRALAGQRCRPEVAHQATFPSTAAQAASVRRYVRECADGSGIADRFPMDDVDVVVTETFANAMEHPDNAHHPITVSVMLRDGVLRLEIRDRAIGEVRFTPGQVCVPTRATEWDDRDRGLWLIDMLSQRWGVIPLNDGKIMFAEVAPYALPEQVVAATLAGSAARLCGATRPRKAR